MHLKGRQSGSGGTASRCGQLHRLVLYESVLHPSFIARRDTDDKVGASGGEFGCAGSRGERLGDDFFLALPMVGKCSPTTRRSTMVTKERNIPLTWSLTYIIVLHDMVLPSGDVPSILARKAPLTLIPEEFAAFRLSDTGDSTDRGKPAASKSFRDQIFD